MGLVLSPYSDFVLLFVKAKNEATICVRWKKNLHQGKYFWALSVTCSNEVVAETTFTYLTLSIRGGPNFNGASSDSSDVQVSLDANDRNAKLRLFA
jgi:hypothetical protein